MKSLAFHGIAVFGILFLIGTGCAENDKYRGPFETAMMHNRQNSLAIQCRDGIMNDPNVKPENKASVIANACPKPAGG